MLLNRVTPRFTLRTVDSDVVVLAITLFQELGLSELWIGCGSGKAYKDIPIQLISGMLGPQKCQALPLFHAFTGCDVVSAMYGIGKKIDDIDPSDVEKPNITLLWLGSENVI